METTRYIDNDLCRILARIARDKAIEIKIPMVIAFADAKGDLVHFQRMEQALPVSTDIAMNKAFTAAGLRTPTHRLGPLTEPGQKLYGLQLTNKGRIVIFGGGFPLSLNSEIIGAIGVSGGSVDQDMAVARAAVEALGRMETMAAILEPMLPPSITDFSSLVQKAGSMEMTNNISPDILEGALSLIHKITNNYQPCGAGGAGGDGPEQRRRYERK